MFFPSYGIRLNAICSSDNDFTIDIKLLHTVCTVSIVAFLLTMFVLIGAHSSRSRFCVIMCWCVHSNKLMNLDDVLYVIGPKFGRDSHKTSNYGYNSQFDRLVSKRSPVN